jgi:hypothetical protein
MATMTEKNAQLDRLRADYKGAFDGWALEVGRRQKVSETTPDQLILQEAEERVETAEIAYRATRNRLADEISTDGSFGGPAVVQA